MAAPVTDTGGGVPGASRGPPSTPGAPPGRRPARLVWEQARLPPWSPSGSVDVHHGPHYTMPERDPAAVVVTVHDLTFLDHPEWHERSKVVVLPPRHPRWRRDGPTPSCA